MVANYVNGDIESLKAHTHGKTVKSKNQLRRLKQKQKKQVVCLGVLPELFCLLTLSLQEKEKGDSSTRHRSDELENIEVETGLVEYVYEQLDLSEAGLEAFSDVFARFLLPPEESSVRIC